MNPSIFALDEVRTLQFLAVSIVGVALASTSAWLVSRFLVRSAALRHLVLSAALVFCFACPAAAAVCSAAGWSVLSAPLLSAARAPNSGDPSVSREAASVDSSSPRMMRSASFDLDRRPLPSGPLDAPSDAVRERVEAPSESGLTDRPSSSIVSSTDAPPAPIFGERPSAWRVLVVTTLGAWAIGSLTLFVRLAWNCIRVMRWRRSAKPCRDKDRLRLLHAAAKELGSRRAPALLESREAVVPLAIDFDRSAVVLPERLAEELSDDELRDVFLHETAHLRHGDPWIALLQGFAGALYWPIVSVHAMDRALREAREDLCDNVVLARRDPVDYGRTLLHVAERAADWRSPGVAVGIGNSAGELERRVAGLLDPRRDGRVAAGRPALVCVAALCLLAGALLATTRFAVAEDPNPDSSASASEASNPKAPLFKEKEPDGEVVGDVVLRGTVLGPEDRPVSGAKLWLILNEWTDPVELGTSEADGSYRFVVPHSQLRLDHFGNSRYAECKALIVATAKGQGVAWSELPSVDGDRYGEMKPEYASDLHLPGDLAIEGQVIDVEGEPVARATVAVRAVHSLTDGRWHKTIPAIESGDPKYMTQEEADVVDWFAPLYPSAWQTIPVAQTDEQGRFRIEGIGADRAAKLEIVGPGIWRTNVAVITRPDAGEYASEIRELYPRTPRPNGYFYPARKDQPSGGQGVRLYGMHPVIDVDPARTIAGTVRLAETGEPLANVEVMVDDGFAAGSAHTDAAGRYRLMRAEDRDAIDVLVRPEAERFVTIVQRVENAKELGEIELDFDLPRGVVVQGRVLEAGTGKPLVSGPELGCHSIEPGPPQTGNVTYYPLATNEALRDSPMGAYFHSLGSKTNDSVSTSIEPDGSFRLHVPPGPGVLIVQSNPGSSVGDWQWMGSESKESSGVHLRSPYLLVDGRTPDDGGPAGEPNSLPGFEGPIPLDKEAHVHAYRVIDPPADAETIDLEVFVPRGETRTLSFVDAEGRPATGAIVEGLVNAGSWLPFRITLDDAEIELVGLVPGEPRTISARTPDGRYAGNAVLSTDDPATKTIRLERSAIVTGRIVDESGKPVPEVSVGASAPGTQWAGYVSTDAEGRFRFEALVAGVPYAASMTRTMTIGVTDDLGKAFENLTLEPGEVRDFGDIRVKLPAPATE